MKKIKSGRPKRNFLLSYLFVSVASRAQTMQNLKSFFASQLKGIEWSDKILFSLRDKPVRFENVWQLKMKVFLTIFGDTSANAGFHSSRFGQKWNLRFFFSGCLCCWSLIQLRCIFAALYSCHLRFFPSLSKDFSKVNVVELEIKCENDDGNWWYER